MADDQTSLYLLVIVAVVAVVGLGLAIASFETQQSVAGMMGGTGGNGMMGNRTTATTSPGAFEWSILIVSAAFFVLAIALLIRGRATHKDVGGSAAAPDPVHLAPGHSPQIADSIPHPFAAESANPTPAAAVPEPTLIKLLGSDERRMYLELRDHGGEMYQRDLVALGIFSKAKVTRVLDKLEAKGLLIREAHGMTNRVRLVNLPAK